MSREPGLIAVGGGVFEGFADFAAGARQRSI
jgi:3-dehydroquinate synthetase